MRAKSWCELRGKLGDDDEAEARKPSGPLVEPTLTALKAPGKSVGRWTGEVPGKAARAGQVAIRFRLRCFWGLGGQAADGRLA